MEDIIIFSFLFLFIGFISWIFFLLFVRYLKGSIVISLPTRIYNYGDTIQGTFTIYAKKDIIAQDLTAHLVCLKKEKLYSKWKTIARVQEVARVSHPLVSEQNYEKGVKKEYHLSFAIPQKNQIFWEQDIPEYREGIIGKFTVYSYRKKESAYYTWQLRVDLQAPWFDISGKRDICVVDKK